MKKQIVVTSTSSKPRFAGGCSFNGTEAFLADKFTAEQLREIIADRLLSVVVGFVLESEGVDAFIQGVKADAAKGAKGA